MPTTKFSQPKPDDITAMVRDRIERHGALTAEMLFSLIGSKVPADDAFKAFQERQQGQKCLAGLRDTWIKRGRLLIFSQARITVMADLKTKGVKVPTVNQTAKPANAKTVKPVVKVSRDSQARQDSRALQGVRPQSVIDDTAKCFARFIVLPRCRLARESSSAKGPIEIARMVHRIAKRRELNRMIREIREFESDPMGVATCQ